MRTVVAVVVAAVLLVAGAGVAAAHVNDLRADTQVSADGTVVVESALLLNDGWLVVHRVGPDGGIGEPIGHAPVPADTFEQSVRVPVDDAVWADWGGNRTVWVVLHREEGSQGFDRSEDPVQESFGSVAGQRITVGRGTEPVYALAEEFETQTTTDGTVTVRRVALGRDDALVVETAGDGRVVGSTALSAGRHENVTVDVEETVFSPANRTARLTAVVYAGGGPGVGRPVSAGDERVGTVFTVERTGPLNATNESAPPPSATEEPAVVTPTPTPAGTGTRTPTGTAADGPGFGVLSALAGFGAALLAVGLRSRA